MESGEQDAQNHGVITQSGLKLLHTFSEMLKNEKSNDGIVKSIVIQEKLIYCGLYCLEEGSMRQLSFDIALEITDFVERVNQLSMSKMQTHLYGQETKMISKAIDMLFNKVIPRVFKDAGQQQHPEVNRLRVLCFTNLSYIYREQTKFSEALKAITYALSIEERLAEINYRSCAKNIVTSYLNKSAILSELKRHDKAILCIKNAIQSVKRLESTAQTDAHRNNVNYLFMVAHYNLANESEELGLRNQCLDAYEQAAVYAKQINNIAMINKISELLESIVSRQLQAQERKKEKMLPMK